MTGKTKGVQARILNQNPRAFFVPCGCHSPSLVVGDAATSSVESMSLFGILQRIYVPFSASVRHWKILTDHVNVTVKPVCETHWECRIDGVKAVRYQTAEVYDALIALAESEQADAGVHHEAFSLACHLTEFKFLVSIAMWYPIPFQVNVVSKSTQSKKNMDIVAATNLINACRNYIQGSRV